jgi:hypothetical protein
MGRERVRLPVDPLVRALAIAPDAPRFDRAVETLNMLTAWCPRLGPPHPSLPSVLQPFFPQAGEPVLLQRNLWNDWTDGWSAFISPAEAFLPQLSADRTWIEEKRRIATAVVCIWQRLWPSVHDCYARVGWSFNYRDDDDDQDVGGNHLFDTLTPLWEPGWHEGDPEHRIAPVNVVLGFVGATIDETLAALTLDRPELSAVLCPLLDLLTNGNYPIGSVNGRPLVMCSR